ncbi:hypothetical protein ACQEU3_38415 [Spirillospora sp. CA-253888]
MAAGHIVVHAAIAATAVLPASAASPAGAAPGGGGRQASNAPFVDRLGCGKALRPAFTYNGVNGTKTSKGARLPAADQGYPDATLTAQNPERDHWETFDYPADYNGGLDPRWQGRALNFDALRGRLTVDYKLTHAQRVFFSVVDLDAYEHLRVVGHRDGTPVVPRGFPRGVANPQVAVDQGALSVRDVIGPIHSGPIDFEPEHLADVVFDEPVDQVRLIATGTANGLASITRFFGCRHTGLHKEAGAPKRVSAGKSRVAYSVPYTLTVTNRAGNMPSRPVVTDSVATAFPKGSVSSITAGKARGPSTPCTPNNAFLARKSSKLLTGAGHLAGGQNCTIHYKVKVSYPRGVNPPAAKSTATLYEGSTARMVQRASTTVDIGAVPTLPRPGCRCRPTAPGTA